MVTYKVGYKLTAYGKTVNIRLRGRSYQPTLGWWSPVSGLTITRPEHETTERERHWLAVECAKAYVARLSNGS